MIVIIKINLFHLLKNTYNFNLPYLLSKILDIYKYFKLYPNPLLSASESSGN